jgi:Predicted ATPases of PP-loop superfamily
MAMPVQNVAMLWTGGKDSAMALHEAVRTGLRVCCLATFAPPQPDFKAHPLAVMVLQAEALGLPHRVLSVAAPFEQGYEAALRGLRDELGIDGVVSGDIAAVGGLPNWMAERCRSLGLTAHAPLWGRDRQVLLRQLRERGFRAILSCIDTRRLDGNLLGRELDGALAAELAEVEARSGVDACGEQGEYHSLVLDGPDFAHGIEIRASARRMAGALAYLEIRELAAGKSRVRAQCVPGA